MALPAASSSSSVKVIYSDPSNVFPLISEGLGARLPLRNLHWNSPSRPLRSIESLFVEFIPDDQNNAGAGSGEGDTVASEARRDPESKKERRHQIPGLRQTPYLKIFLLRCDDIESYKSTWRKTLREWIKANTPPSQSSSSASNQENHDAFEWMIVHVAAFDTTNGPGWPNRALISVIDKVRADFQGSSKSQISRIAQLPVLLSDSRQASKDVSSLARPEREAFRSEAMKAWEDLLVKVKLLILTSFDLRVRQYEEDIKEKGSQRNLPGWNLCTFFILKEGLARGFESVGLVEDALIGYDELSVELQNAINDRKESSTSSTNLFLDFTEELFASISAILASAEEALDTSTKAPGLDFSALDAEQKPYRELILSSSISAFDFQNYVFARQFSLLSRLARLTSTAGRLNEVKDPEDVPLVAEITRRSIVFVTHMGNTMREDLEAALHYNHAKINVSPFLKDSMTEELIALWTYSTCQQILRETTVVSLSKPLQQNLNRTPRQKMPLEPEQFTEANTNTRSPSPKPPVRTSSLQDRSSPVSTSSAQDVFSDNQSHPLRSPIHHQLQHSVRHLAVHRAELYLIARRSLHILGLRHGWKTGWISVIDDNDPANFQNVPLIITSSEVQNESIPFSMGVGMLMLPALYNKTLTKALSSKDAFYLYYEELSLSALELYRLSRTRKFAQSVAADIAVIKFFLKDYEAAATYFKEMVLFYGEENWRFLEANVLRMYAQCLKELDRVDEYINVALEMLAKGVDNNRHAIDNKFRGEAKHSLANMAASSLLGLIETSKKLRKPVFVPLQSYFRKVSLNPYIQHLEDQDGFQMILNLLCVMSDEVIADWVKIHIISNNDKQPWEIHLASAEHVPLTLGELQIPVVAKAMFPGWYMIETITISCANIVFKYEGRRLNKGVGGVPYGMQDQPSFGQATLEQSLIRVWPEPGALRVHVGLCREIHLEQLRSIMLEISSGHNNINFGELLVRAGSAGLRLQTSDVEVIEGDTRIIYDAPTGLIRFECIAENSVLKVRIPYRLENDTKEISVRTEVTYSTVDGNYTYGDVYNLSVLLPLGVNVQDIFKRRSLFSKFAISASTPIPLRLLACRVEGTDDFEAASTPLKRSGLFISQKQPVSMACKITRKTRGFSVKRVPERRLSMHIEYQCLDEEICAAFSNTFLTDLGTGKFAKFVRLLQPWAEMVIRSRLLNYDLDVIGLSREIDLGTFDDFGWQRLLEGMPVSTRVDLGLWLHEWHQKRQVVGLPHHISGLLRYIIIPVDVPEMHVVHSARLGFFQRSPRLDESPGVLAVGEIVSAELILKHSRQWDTGQVVGKGKRSSLGFYYEIETNPETWLVAGQRRAFFSAMEDQVVTFPVILIPQRPGHLPYPGIEIRHAEEKHGQESTEGPLTLNCDVDYQSQGESIHVVRDLGSTTIGLDVDGPRTDDAQLIMSARTERATELAS